MSVTVEIGSNGTMVLVEPALRKGLTRRVFRYMPNGALEWAALDDWRASGERARFFGFASKELPESMRSILMAETFFRKALLDDKETEIEVEIAVHTWGCSAHMGSMSYAGHPAEGPEVEIIKAWLLEEANLPDAPDILASLTDAERERIEIEFCEDPPEPSEPDWD